ncbi:MAG TPA: hydroxyisourate hydrolase [Candidatus Polarisedimenticolia bacterium]|jgi:5-hydroxyisourate hydrolase|nr:hydroxyisourate hydrolase [Candidatus Polarisedimenticolia bacterium]
MSVITTHVLDTVTGEPAPGIPVLLEFRGDSSPSPTVVGRGKTDMEGRICHLVKEDHALEPGVYCLRFDTSAVSPFFPEISVVFRIAAAQQHYHVPLLLSRFGYSTYRGN